MAGYAVGLTVSYLLSFFIEEFTLYTVVFIYVFFGILVKLLIDKNKLYEEYAEGYKPSDHDGTATSPRAPVAGSTASTVVGSTEASTSSSEK